MQTNNKKKNERPSMNQRKTQGDVVHDNDTLTALFLIIFFSIIISSLTLTQTISLRQVQLNVYQKSKTIKNADSLKKHLREIHFCTMGRLKKRPFGLRAARLTMLWCSSVLFE